MSNDVESSLPIEQAGASISMADIPMTRGPPTVATVDSENEDYVPAQPPRKSNRLYLWGGIVCTFLALLIVIPLATTAQRRRASRRPSLEEITVFLADSGVDVGTTTSTDQYKVAKWMAEDDPAPPPLPKTDDEAMLYLARYVMALIHFSMNGDEWVTHVDFLSDYEICEWHGQSFAYAPGEPFSARGETGGFFCDREKGLPFILDLEFNNMRGTIPTELGLLTTLQALDLEHNFNIRGTIPTELCQLTDLLYLSITNNALTGMLPPCLGELTKLQYLMAEVNDLTGTLPAAVCDMTNMKSFILNRNEVEGSFPTCMGEWTSLETLIISNNMFTGSLPDSFRQLTKLKNVWLDDNLLTGDPGPVVNEWHDVDWFFLSNNMFDGALDENFLANANALTIADLSNNSFVNDTDHAIPPQLLALPQLEILDLNNNRLNGRIHDVIVANDKLLFLSAYNNQIIGEIPPALTNLETLLHLDLSKNELSGEIPTELFNMKTMVNLFLADNVNLEPGSVPSDIEDMTQLRELSLKRTNRNGFLPSLQGFDNLTLLDLDDNNFEGTVPLSYNELPKLRYILLNRNPLLNGELPSFEQSSLLTTVLVDATDISGDFEDICQKPSFADTASEGNNVLVAYCDNVTCSCCHCCQDDGRGGGCSDPVVDNLDLEWERQFRRMVRNFGVNRSNLEPPDDGRF